MADLGASINSALQTQRMLTQLQTQLGAISMHCGELHKLCVDRADPRKVELKCSVLKDEEKAIFNLLKDLRSLKEKQRLSEQQQLDTRLRALSAEYSSALEKLRKAITTGHEYCSHMQSMTASMRSSRNGEEQAPRRISLGEGMGAALLVEETLEDAFTAEEEARLESDVRELSLMFQDLLEHTTDQGRRIDTLEAHMDAAADQARNGAREVAEAARYSASAVPLAAALLGGAVGGPLGMLVGLKAAATLTAVAGMGLGYVTGSWYKKRVHASVDAAKAELDQKQK